MSTAASAGRSQDTGIATPPARRRPRPATLAWAAAIAGLFLLALALRLWGLRTGLPFVYNADENAHFVPRAIGMFGHSYNPDYFINPPAYTYLVHVALWLRFGGREAVGASYAADPTTVFTIARALSGLLGALAVGFLAWAGARMFDRRTGFVAALLLAVAFLPVHYGHFALNDVPTLAPLCVALVRDRAACCAAGTRSTTRWRAPASAWRARPSTRPGSSCSRCSRPRRSRATRAASGGGSAAWRSRACSRSAAS